MFIFFKQSSLKRISWFLLALSALLLESIALYFQHGMGLQPCVLCVYERVAVLGIFIAGLLGMLLPNALIVRVIALGVGLASAVKGLLISWQHLDLQMDPQPYKQCEFIPNFPETLPLHKWFPAIFNPTGSCNESQWALLGLTMVQWLVVIFAAYVIVLLIVSICQFKKTHKQRRLFN